MTDVRLTATNPEDSSVVPVACNAKGELLIEEPTLAVDDYVSKTDTASQNIVSDLTLGADKITLDATDGSAKFDVNVEVGDFDNTTGTKAFASGSLQVRRNDSNTAIVVYKDGTTTGNQTAVVNADGSADFVSNGVQIEETAIPYNNTGNLYFRVGRLEDGSHPILRLQTKNADSNFVYSDIKLDGTITKLGATGVDVGVLRMGVGSNGANILTDSIGVDYNGSLAIGLQDDGTYKTLLSGTDGSAAFAGDVVVGSRSKKWMLVEQGGLCHMVEQLRATPATEYPPLRDVIAELNVIEAALGEVMEKLRMTPPAGWEVWDGSDEIS